MADWAAIVGAWRAKPRFQRLRTGATLTRALRTCLRSYCAPVIQGRAVLGILTYIKYAPLPALRPSLSDGRSLQIVNRFFRRSHLWPLLLPHQPLLPLRPA